MRDDPLYERTALLIGTENCRTLSEKCVLIVGTGGVGGAAVEFLVRAGIGKMVLVDGDEVDETNRNRQFSALTSTAGKSKVAVWERRCREINPRIVIEAVDKFLRSPADIAELLDFARCDFAIDAIDEIEPKIELISALYHRQIPFVSSMGAGGKVDPSAIQSGDISKSFGCPLARNVRKLLREKGISKGVKCIFSPEPPLRKFEQRKIGSISYIPAIFGAFCAKEAIFSLLPEKFT